MDLEKVHPNRVKLLVVGVLLGAVIALEIQARGRERFYAEFEAAAKEDEGQAYTQGWVDAANALYQNRRPWWKRKLDGLRVWMRGWRKGGWSAHTHGR